MMQIRLQGGQIATVEDVDYGRLSSFRWHIDKDGYAVRTYQVAGKQKRELMHRAVSGAPLGLEVDHRNMDRLDNRRENLRVCTSSQNKFNKTKKSNNTSGYKGVHYYKSRGNYQVQLQAEGKRVNVGYFRTAEEAARAYDNAALLYHGEFARLNFPVTNAVR